MLTWEEEVKPTSPIGAPVSDLNSHLHSSPSPVLAPTSRVLNDGAVRTEPLPASGSRAFTSAAAPSGRRVNAADKRIITGQTDVTQLVQQMCIDESDGRVALRERHARRDDGGRVKPASVMDRMGERVGINAAVANEEAAAAARSNHE